MTWSTVSKAAVRSSRSKITELFLSTAVFNIFHSVHEGFKVRFVSVCLFDPVDNLSSASKVMFILYRIAFAPARKPDRASVHALRSVHTRRQVAPTCRDDTSQRQIASCVLENSCENLCVCNRILSQRHVAKNQIRQNLCDLSRRQNSVAEPRSDFSPPVLRSLPTM